MQMRWMWGALVVLLLAMAMVACNGDPERGPSGDGGGAAQTGETSDLPVVTFETAGGATPSLSVEVADTPELDTCGLMHRLSMPENQAMLFAFSEDSTGPFWNRNTFIPLTLAWIAADGTIVDLTDMANVRPEDNPQINSFYSPQSAYRYVIEANQGWFARNGVAVGDHARVEDAIARGSQGAVPICREKGL